MGLKALLSTMAICKNLKIKSSVLPTLLFFALLLELSTAQAAIPQRAAARLKQQAMFTLTW